MAWLLSVRLVFLLLVVAAAVAKDAQAPAPAPALTPSLKTAKCTNKTFPACYKKIFPCPDNCPNHCMADCESCQAICRPNKVRCKNNKLYPECSQKVQRCPANCPTNCHVDCVTCQPVCGTAPPPPPPPPPRAKSPPAPNHPPSSPPLPPPPANSPPAPSHPPTSPPPPPPPANSPPAPNHPPSSPPLPPPPANSPPAPSHPPTSPPPPPSANSPPAPSHPPSSPPPPSGPVKVSCKNKNYTDCYGMVHYCPSGCPERCEVDCVTCKPVCDCNKPGAVCQDPRFVGADGLTFYFHGKKDRDFCLVTDSNLHINAHFIGRRNEDMLRDFTWVQSLGILFDNHKLFIGAKKTATWDDAKDRLALSFDGQTIILREEEDAKWTFGDRITIKRTRNTNSVKIEVEDNFRIKATVVPITKRDSRIHNYGITQEDCFAHLDLNFKFYSLSGDVDGVLGQTYGRNYVSRVKMGIAMPVLGGDKEFASSGLFATDCSVARFSGQTSHKENYEFGNLNCASGMDGRGVVCKR